MAAHDPSAGGPPGPFGPLLAHLRLRRGWSQLRLAEHLCAASAVPTVSRHEVSRWERHERIPGDFWLGWLAVVLEVPPDELTAAAAASRPAARRSAPAIRRGPDAAGRATAAGELLAMAHAWLAGDLDVARPPRDDPGDLAARLAAVRRLDDVVGGVDLAPIAARRLGGGSPSVRATGGPRLDRRLDRRAGRTHGRRAGRTPGRVHALAAEADQLLGWTLADAGDTAGALAAYRRALAAAAAAGDHPLAGHVLGCASHLLVTSGDPRSALLLARTAVAGCRRGASATGRALLLHRVAAAAAACGLRGTADEALAAAQRAAEQHDPGRDPSWLYWLDPGELEAMAGRCLAAMGRPLRARPPLERAARRSGQPRTAALDRAWLACAYVDLGEVEHACDVAAAALVDTVRSGSVRAAGQLDRVHHRLRPHHGVPAVRRYAATAAAARPYLPRRAGGASRAARATGD